METKRNQGNVTKQSIEIVESVAIKPFHFRQILGIIFREIIFKFEFIYLIISPRLINCEFSVKLFRKCIYIIGLPH